MLRWTAKHAASADGPATLVAGVAYDELDEHRRGFQNFVGTTLGVQGALRRDEDNDVANFDQYVQGSWQLRAALDACTPALRHSKVRFASEDHYIVGPNPDDSGSVRLRRDAAGGRR